MGCNKIQGLLDLKEEWFNLVQFSGIIIRLNMAGLRGYDEVSCHFLFSKINVPPIFCRKRRLNVYYFFLLRLWDLNIFSPNAFQLGTSSNADFYSSRTSPVWQLTVLGCSSADSVELIQLECPHRLDSPWEHGRTRSLSPSSYSSRQMAHTS